MLGSSSLPDTGAAARLRFSFVEPVWLLFALCTGALTLRHAMWFDEVQAWLLVRDSNSLATLFHHLHYEGHPALWYLLLYPLTRVTADPAVMQMLNYVLALVLAALILTAPRLRPLPAILIVFSSILFNEYSTYARSYLLAALLIVAAVRFLLAERQRPVLAFLCMGLAINTHFLTVPIVLALAGWFVLTQRDTAERTWVQRLISRRALAYSAILLASLAACYATVRPAADLLPLDVNQPSVLGHFFFVMGRLWRIFFRIPIGHLPPRVIALLDPKLLPTVPATVLSAFTLLLTLMALRSRQARLFLAVCFLLGLVVLAQVTLTPETRHYGFLYVAFVAAILIDAAQPHTESATGIAARMARPLLYLILAQQCLLSLSVSFKEWRHPISGSVQTARWLQVHGLAENSMLMEPNDGPNALLGYLNKPSAWFPACQCWGSFAHRAAGTDSLRMATPNDLVQARANSPLPVILVANFPLTQAVQQTLGVEFLFASSPEAIKPNDNFFLYRETAR